MYQDSRFLKWFGIIMIAGLIGAVGAYLLKSGIAGLNAINPLPVWMGPTAAGLCMALITHWDKRVLGSGAEQFVRAVSERNTDFSLTTAFSKLAATVATLGFGASGGTEGLR